MSKKEYKIRLSDDYKKAVERLINVGGYENMPEVVRASIRKLYKAEFGETIGDSIANGNLYTETRPLQVESNHEKMFNKAKDKVDYCVNKLGGQVVNVDGKDYCEYPDGSMSVWLPL